MTTTTFPSRILTIVDVDEPTNVTGKYYYNYFVPDERTNGSGDAFFSSAVDRIDLNQLQRDIPRFTLLSWSPIVGTKVKFRSRGGPLLNNQTVELVNTEDTFSNFDYTSFFFQDVTIDRKLTAQINNSTTFRGFVTKSLIRRAKALNSETGSSINGNLLVNIFSDKEMANLLTKSGLSSTTKILETVKNATTNAQVNSKFVGTMVRASAYDPLNFYSDEMELLVSSADALQSRTRQAKDAHLVSTSEFDAGFNPIVVTKIDGQNSRTPPEAYPVGYIVERSELNENGNVVEIASFVLSTPSATSFYDASVKYGVLYRYTVKAVVALTLPGFNDEQQQVLATGLVSSKQSQVIDIDCNDYTPPPPPADFKVTWNYSDSAVQLLWSLPPEKQRDIKYFQVFRRRSIAEPFSLLKMYNFDDSEVVTSSGEVISDKNTELLTTPKGFYIDRDVSKDGTYIYALCCIDAHGLTSNYSHQYLAKFDRFKNSLIVKTVSRSGAPKNYPNLFLEEDTFVDVIKVSDPSSLNVCFDPEFLKVLDNNDNDVKFLPLEDPNYKVLITFLNVDNSLSKTLTLNFSDRRSQVIETGTGGANRVKPRVSISGLKIEGVE